VYKPLKSVTHGQCDAGTQHRTGLRLPSQSQDTTAPQLVPNIYCLVTEAHVWTTCPRLSPASGTIGSWIRDLSSRKPTP